MFFNRLSFPLLMVVLLISSACSFSLSSCPTSFPLSKPVSGSTSRLPPLSERTHNCGSYHLNCRDNVIEGRSKAKLVQRNNRIEKRQFATATDDSTGEPKFMQKLATIRGGASTVTTKFFQWEQLKVWVFIALWYGFNIQFNIQNKQLLTAMPLPWTVSICQLGAGSLYIGLLWLLKIRKAPIIEKKDVKTLSTLSWFHAVSHITAVSAIGAGAVSFTHVVKAAEPFFSALFAALFFKQYFHPMVYTALIPVVGGVSYASFKELNFSMLAFVCAMTSNIVCAARGVVVKGVLSDSKPSKNKISTSNLYGILTVCAFVMLLPFAFLFEGSKWFAMIASSNITKLDFLKLVLGSGLSFYLYNEVAFLALESLHPISHAVVNTIKRVVIIGVTVVVFQNPFPLQSQIGSGVAIGGVLLYSLAKHYFK